MRWDGRACLQPFVDYFVQCDNYAGSLYGRAVTVECVDRYGMKLISKVFVKMCAATTPLSPFSFAQTRRRRRRQTRACWRMTGTIHGRSSFSSSGAPVRLCPLPCVVVWV